jgi:hypothetical protein
MNTAATEHTMEARKPVLARRRILILAVALLALVATLTTTAQASRASAASDSRSLVGTWLFDVPETEGGTPAFQSLLTFHKGGTLTEVSAELGLGFQGPAQGVWQKRGNQYVATFQTWVFNGDTGVVEGRVQIRARFHKTSRDSFEGWTVIDFIELDGTVIPDIDRGPVSATRERLQAP